MVNPQFWKDRKVFLTGHTGFKGSWLTLWLRELGAVTTGYSLKTPPSVPDLFSLANLSTECLGGALTPSPSPRGRGEEHTARDLRGDIGDTVRVTESLKASGAEIVFHLAAQPLVRESYRDPAETWRVNVMGTLAVLEACRACPTVKTIVIITTDKVYENPERGLAFGEDDPLGGHDPYSSSKAAAEILCASWRRSFVESDPTRTVGLATARAGNVIGGGDFAVDRLVPDLVRAKQAGTDTRLRYPDAVRPWQHVLEPLGGYIRLAEALHGDPRGFSTAFNFGPDKNDFRPVREVADRVSGALGSTWIHEQSPQVHEAGLLTLDSTRAASRLGWVPRLPFVETLNWTSSWYAQWLAGADARTLTLAQIRAYQTLIQAPS